MSDGLRRRLEHMIGATANTVSEAVPKDRFNPVPWEQGYWQQSGGEYFFVADHRWLKDAAWGIHSLDKFLELDQQEQEVLGVTGYNPEKILFLDTETTGLAGGAGTLAFLIGCGRFREESFQIEQFFIHDHSSERAVLEVLKPLLEETEAIVTYNGRAFDWPLLRDRFTINRISLDRKDITNVDLLPLARVLWRDALPDCRLVTVEQKVLEAGEGREGDVPGWAIPGLYFNFLKDRDFAPLQPVFRHNRLDILTLVTLAVEISATLAYPLYKGSSRHKDLLRLGAYWERRGNCHLSLACYRACREDKSRALAAAKRMAAVHKRMGEWQEAVQLWKEIAESNSFDIDVFIELAKVYEHQWKQHRDALHITEQAIAIARQRRSVIRSRQEDEIELALQHRRRRLLKKCSQ